MIKGLDVLTRLRLSGRVPSKVMISIGDDYQGMSVKGLIEVVAVGDVKSDDFRPFDDLDVMLFAPQWTQTAEDTLAKLKEHASEIAVLVAEYGTDIGYFWTREHGNVDLDDYRWVKQYNDARKMVCRTPGETAERVRLESEAIQNCTKKLGVSNGILH